MIKTCYEFFSAEWGKICIVCIRSTYAHKHT